MSGRLKDFSQLKALSTHIKQEHEARQRREAEERARREREAREANLFRAAVGEIAPLKDKGRAEIVPPKPTPVARQQLEDDQAVLRESLSDEFTAETLIETDEALSYARSGVGPDVLKKLRTGHWVIQSQLDLHGLRTDEARETLGEYLRNAVRRGIRCVRIVHGKGLGSINREPVLKNKVRNWLIQKEEVIAFCQARAADGGAGALVVLLQA